jgi:hypothetical protein
MTDALRATEIAITAIETAQKSGIRLIPDGHEIDIDSSSCDDAEQAKTILAILRHNKEAIVGLTSSQATVQQVLASSRIALVEADKYVHDHLDLWVRLEDIYRTLWPDDTACITGEGQCGAIRSEIVRCKVCEATVDPQ